MVQIPHEFILLQGIPVPEKGRYGTGLVFLPKEAARPASTRRRIEPWPASSSKTCFFPSVFVYLYEPEKSW